MTVPELIANVLENLRVHFYTHEDFFRVREFKRDERQLIKAIATYGHECNQRGWEFDADFIYRELLQLLLQIRTSGAHIEYLPVYLAGAIRRHIGQRAEELSARAKGLPRRVSKALEGIQAVPQVITPSDVEVFTEVFRGISKIQRAQKRGASVKNRPKQVQQSFL